MPFLSFREVSLPGSCRKLKVVFTSFQAVPLAGHTGLFASSSCFRDAGRGAVGAGCPSLSRRAACLCTADCGPLPSAAISEGGKNGDLKGSEVCVGGSVCSHRDRRVNKHTCARVCLHTCAMEAWGNQLPRLVTGALGGGRGACGVLCGLRSCRKQEAPAMQMAPMPDARIPSSPLPLP